LESTQGLRYLSRRQGGLTQDPAKKAGLACHAGKAGSTSYFEFTFWAFQNRVSLINVGLKFCMKKHSNSFIKTKKVFIFAAQ
jgi:hypothetical protein